MKRILSPILVLSLFAILLSGCIQNPFLKTGPNFPPATEPVHETITVSNIDEFLDALGSDRTIIMEPGNYNLTDASSYGLISDSPYYSWEDAFDGYELVLNNIRNLTVTGSGMEQTILETVPRCANVLVLNNCANVTLRDFTAGHTELAEICEGGVILLDDSAVISLERLGLYGCGIEGVTSFDSYDISIMECDIYDCSSSGIYLLGSSNVSIRNCSFYGIGNDSDYIGCDILYVGDSHDVTMNYCLVFDCNLHSLIDSYVCSSNITIKNTSFQNNLVGGLAFNVDDIPITVDDCIFSNNDVESWCDSDRPDMVKDIIGNILTEEYFMVLNGSQSDETDDYPEPTEPEETIPLPQREIVNAATVDEFLAAIGPNREIVLTGAMYDLSTASNYGRSGGEYYYWFNEFDGPELVINAVENMVIRSNDGNVTGHTIAAVPRYADVLTFQNCSYIEISGFTAGHTLEPGYCCGGVINIENSDYFTVSDCGLFGCGTWGVTSEGSSKLTVRDCDIYECSEGGIWLSYTTGITVDNCTFRDLGGSTMYFYECSKITVDGERLPTRSDIEIP